MDRGAGLSRSVDHPPATFVAWRQWAAAAAGERERENEREATWTWHRKLLKLHKTNCWALAFPLYWKTISTVIKGELNRLISSKVTEQPPLSPSHSPSSFSPSSLVLTVPQFSLPSWRWRPSMKCHQISGGLEVIGQKCSVECALQPSEKKGCVFCFPLIDGR